MDNAQKLHAFLPERGFVPANTDFLIYLFFSDSRKYQNKDFRPSLCLDYAWLHWTDLNTWKNRMNCFFLMRSILRSCSHSMQRFASWFCRILVIRSRVVFWKQLLQFWPQLSIKGVWWARCRGCWPQELSARLPINGVWPECCCQLPCRSSSESFITSEERPPWRR